MIDEFRVQMMERENGAPESVPALMIEMWIGTQQSARKSKLAGRPIFEEVPWISISVPGEQNKSFPVRPVNDSDKRRFPRAYAALMDSEKKPAIEGTPIEHWAAITRSEAMSFRASNIPTIEALAEVRDEHIDKLGTSGREWRAKARAVLTGAKDAALAQQLAAEKETLMAMIAEQGRQIKELAAKLEGQEEVKRGPGRPRKVQEDAA